MRGEKLWLFDSMNQIILLGVTYLFFRILFKSSILISV